MNLKPGDLTRVNLVQNRAIGIVWESSKTIALRDFHLLFVNVGTGRHHYDGAGGIDRTAQKSNLLAKYDKDCPDSIEKGEEKI